MKFLRMARANLFPITVTAAYLVLFIFRPTMGVKSLQNSVYYIKEMLMVMPVIFVLTALLDAWVPKEQITRFLGESAGFKGHCIHCCWAVSPQGQSTRRFHFA